MTEQPAAKRRSALDLRMIIASLIGVYGVVLTIMGIGFTSPESIAKAAGVNINLWAGLAMLVFGGLMLLWAFTRPLGDELTQAEEDGEYPERAAPRGVDAAALASHQRRGRPGAHDERPVGPDDARP